MLEEDGGTIEADYTTPPEPYGNALGQHRSGDFSFYLRDGIRYVLRAELMSSLWPN